MRQLKTVIILFLVLGITGLPAQAYEAPQAKLGNEAINTSVSTLVWRHPGHIESLNLLYGPGSADLQPVQPITFVKELTEGATPKFEVMDKRGVHWLAKLGEEAQSETAAVRLLWAAGYFTDEAYYFSELRVEKMPEKLEKGKEFLSEGLVHTVRLEPIRTERKKVGEWSWSDNPLAQTREMNGLRVMMALINNWDLKPANNAIYSIKGQSYYAVSDLGASFGKTGGIGSRTKSSLEDYTEAKFVDKAEADVVDLNIKSRPLFVLAVDPYHYFKLTSREKVGKDIPREDAKWLGELLGSLSVEQIRDCFRAAGYSPAEVDGFTKVVQGRIAVLNSL
jgi:hypothetical protein